MKENTGMVIDKTDSVGAAGTPQPTAHSARKCFFDGNRFRMIVYP